MSVPELDRPFDEGLQPERTALSWQRTTLAFAVGFLLAARLFANVLGPASYLFVAVGLVVMAGLFVLGYRRYRAAHRILVTAETAHVRLPGAMPLFAVAAAVFGLALCGLVLAMLAAVMP